VSRAHLGLQYATFSALASRILSTHLVGSKIHARVVQPTRREEGAVHAWRAVGVRGDDVVVGE